MPYHCEGQLEVNKLVTVLGKGVVDIAAKVQLAGNVGIVPEGGRGEGSAQNRLKGVAASTHRRAQGPTYKVLMGML